MSVMSRMIDRLIPGRRRVPTDRLKIANLTRQTILADRVEVADSAANRNKGLLGRRGLEVGEGLWIVPCSAVHTFGMRFTIDLVYIGRDKRVKKVCNSVPPWHMSSCITAHSVVELASGIVCATQTKAGDLLEFSPSAV